MIRLKASFAPSGEMAQGFRHEVPAMLHHLKTRIVLANGAHAKWVERKGSHFPTLYEMHAEPAPAPRAKASIQHGGAAPVPHATGEADIKEKGRDRFAQTVAGRINAEVVKGEYDRLAIVAPAEVLNAIVDDLSAAAKEKLVHTLQKDLTRVPNHELGAWLDSPTFG